MTTAQTVLIADDEEALRLLVHETLADDTITILEAGDGYEALDIARTKRPDVMLLDVAMPGMTGFEVCRTLKSDPTTATITIIMLTAHGQSSDRQRAEAAGADHFIVKPFSPIQLLRLVDRVL